MLAGAHRAGPGQGGSTPLHLAARDGYVEVAEKLLAAGAAVDVAAGIVRAPLAGEGGAGVFRQQRCRAGSLLVSPFSSGGGGGSAEASGGRARIDGSSRGTGRGAGRGTRAGAHRAGPGQGGLTPLHMAAAYGRVEVAEKLLAAGAAVGAKGKVRAPLAGEGGRRVFNVESGVFHGWHFLFQV